MSEAVIIELENINKSYHMGENTIHVLKDVSLTVSAGDFVAVLGVSGSGKSTLMNIIGCMDTLDSGTYHINGHDINGLSEEGLTKVRSDEIGFVFQNYHLIPQYTVLQNIILPLLTKGYSRKEAIEASKSVIELVGLEDRIDHRPKELSGGQQQRVAIARALITNPTLILADEPTGALDSKTGESILKLFRELNESGKTIIMITHDQKVAENAKRIVRIKDGVLS